MVFSLPADVDQRPVVIDGGDARAPDRLGVRGGWQRRAYLRPLGEQREAARDYVEEHVAETKQTLGYTPPGAGESKSPMTCRRPSPAHGW